MPIPLIYQPQARRISELFRRIAELVDQLAVGGEGGNYSELQQVANSLERIAGVLEKGVLARSLSPAQIRTIAAGFEAIGGALSKGLVRRSPRKRTTRRPARRATTKKTTGRKTTRRTRRS